MSKRQRFLDAVAALQKGHSDAAKIEKPKRPRGLSRRAEEEYWAENLHMVSTPGGKLALADFFKKRSVGGDQKRPKDSLLKRLMTAHRNNACLAMVEAEIAGGLTRGEAIKKIAKRLGKKASTLRRLKPVRRVKY